MSAIQLDKTPNDMQLYLDSFGAYLSVQNGMLAVRTRSGGTRLFALRSVGAVLMTRGTALSADAALLAVEHDIPVLLIDANTHYPLATVSGARPGSIATIRKNQAVFARSADGFAWVAAQIAEKIARQRQLLLRLAETPAASPAFRATVPSTERILTSLEQEFVQWKAPGNAGWGAADMESVAGRFRGQEGTASRLYFQQLAAYLAGHTDFSGRQKRPAYDPFNALLNYLYGMLYTSVHLAMLKSGLDPHLGILHADQYGAAPTLVFDAIEPYRPWADEVAVHLVLGGSITESSFEPDPEDRGLWLGSAGKTAVIEAMLEFLQTTAAYDRRMVRRGVHIDFDAQKLAVFLKGWQ